MDKLDMVLNELQDIKNTLKTISENQINISQSLREDSTSVHYNQNVKNQKDRV